MCDQRTLLSSYVSGFRFYRGFLLPFLVTLRKVAANASHYLQVFYSACCYHSIFEYLSHFPRLFILEIHSRSVSIPSDFVRQFGCLSCFQKDYLHNLPDSLLFRHTFRKGYFVSNLILIQACTVRSGHHGQLHS